jgi:predicted nucleotidyltransferase
MLERLMGSRTRVRLLEILLLGGKPLYVRELARRTGANINSVRRELRNLEEMGLVESRREGPLKFHSANRDSPLYDDLRSLLLKTEGVAGVLRAGLAELGEVEEAFLYGSFARGEEALGSDIDVLIVGRVDEEELARRVRGLEEVLSRAVNWVVFSPEEFQRRKEEEDPFVMEMIQEPRLRIIGG